VEETGNIFGTRSDQTSRPKIPAMAIRPKLDLEDIAST